MSRGLVGLLALAGVGASCGKPAPDPACDPAAGTRLLAEGRVERAARALEAILQRCPARASELAVPLVTALGELGRESTLEATIARLGDAAKPPAAVAAIATARTRAKAELRDPRALLVEGLDARAAGDEPTARRRFDRARAFAEGATPDPAHPASVVAGEALVINNALATATLGQESIPWSPDGRWVIFARGDGQTSLGSPHGLTVVDTVTFASFRIDAPARPLFAPDGRHLVLEHDRGMSILDLATGATVVAARPTTIEPRFAPDGRLVWADRVGDEDRVYLRNLTTGKETILRAPARGSADEPDDTSPSIAGLDFGPAGQLVAWSTDVGSSTWGTPGTIRVWDGDRDHPAPIAIVEGLADPEPTVDADGLLVYASELDDPDIVQLRYLELRTPGATSRAPAAKAPCGAGVIDRYTSIARCGSRRYVTVTATHACAWDLATGKLLRAIPKLEHTDVSCTGDLVQFHDGVPPGHTDSISITTGRLTGSVDGPMEEEPEEDAEALDPRIRMTLKERSVTLDDSIGASDLATSPTEAFVAGIAADGSATIWDARGSTAWRSARPSAAFAIAFARDHELVITDATGRIWHLDLVTSAMRVTPAPDDCRVETFAVAPDARALAFCNRREGGMSLLVEGQAAPAFSVTGYSWQPVLAASRTAASAAIHDQTGVHVWSLPDGAKRWTASDQGLQGQDPIGIPPAGDRLVTRLWGELVMRDARDTEQWKTKPPRAPGGAFVFGFDGTRFASAASRFGGILVYDATTGGELDMLESASSGFAFDPTGSLIVFWQSPWEGSAKSTATPGLTIRDLRTKQTAAKREYTGGPYHQPIDRYVDQIAWSSDGSYIAAITGGPITIWKDKVAPHATIVPSEGGIAVIAADGRVTLLGDAAAARATLACRVGVTLYPFELCEDRVLGR